MTDEQSASYDYSALPESNPALHEEPINTEALTAERRRLDGIRAKVIEDLLVQRSRIDRNLATWGHKVRRQKAATSNESTAKKPGRPTSKKRTEPEIAK